MQLTYFGIDGNYGPASDIVIVNTEHWTEEMWDILDAAYDWDRPRVAYQMNTLEDTNA